MKRTLFLCIMSVCFFLVSLHTQASSPGQTRIDSLISVLNKQKGDTNKVNTLNELAWEFYASNYDNKKALQYAEEALSLAQKIRFARGEATACRRRGGIELNSGHYGDAMKSYSRELKLQKEIGDKNRIALGYMQVGSVYFYLGNYPSALENYLSGLKIAEEIKDRISTSKISNNIGLLYCNTGDYQEALKYYTAALNQYEAMGDKEGVAKECVGIGHIHFGQRNYTDALLYFRKSLKTAEETGMKRVAVTCYIDIGELYTAMGDYNEALKNQVRGLNIAEKMSDPYLLVHIKKGIGWTYFNLKKWDEARKYLNDALAKATEMGLIEGMEYCYYRLSKLDSATGNFNSSFENYKLFVFYRDSILNGETSQKIARQKMQYEYNKTEELEKAEQARKDMWQIIIRYSILGGLVIVTVFLLLVFRQRNKIRNEKKISEEERKKAETERKRAELQNERSEELLLNILPAEVAEEIKRDGHSKAKTFSMVTVMMTDFKDFTSASERYSAELLVAEIDFCFSAFDKIIQKYGVEKIKTIGDAYMCVGGMPVLTTTHAHDVVNAAIGIRNFMAERKKEQDAKGGIAFELRLGVHTGPVVAGIVGVNKYAYDIWGNTVNLAARMEQNSEAGKINISGSTYQLVKDKFKCTYRGKVEVKNKGEVEMYFVE
jgi:adenylate cyclase